MLVGKGKYHKAKLRSDQKKTGIIKLTVIFFFKGNSGFIIIKTRNPTEIIYAIFSN